MLLQNKTKWLMSALLICLSMVISLSGAAAGGLGPANGTLQGVISDTFGRHIPDAMVSLYSPDRVLQARTNAKGEFEFTNVPAGTYQFEAWTPGFVAKTIDAVQIADKHSPLEIALTVANTGNCPGAKIIYGRGDASLRGKLTGVITGATQRMANATVQLVNTSTAHVQTSAHTNENGEFLFTDLEAGQYLLQVSAPGYHDEQTQRFWIARETKTKVVVEVVKQGMMRVCQ